MDQGARSARLVAHSAGRPPEAEARVAPGGVAHSATVGRPRHGATRTENPQVSGVIAEAAHVPRGAGRRLHPRRHPVPWPSDPPPDATPGIGKCWSAGWRGPRAITHTCEKEADFVEVEAESVLRLSSDVMTVLI